jgi:hypothetical protein
VLCKSSEDPLSSIYVEPSRCSAEDCGGRRSSRTGVVALDSFLVAYVGICDVLTLTLAIKIQ